MCNPFFPMLNPSDPPPGFPRHNTPSQQYFPLLPASPDFLGMSPQPPPPPARPTQGAAYMQPGPYAKLGVFIDTQNTETPDREMAQELGQRFGCHTCGGQPAQGQRFVADHQPPSNFYTGQALNQPQQQLYEFDHNGTLFQTTDPYLTDSVGAIARPSTFGQHQFIYPQCPDCSNKQGGFVSGGKW